MTEPWIIYIRYALDPLKPDTAWASALIQVPHAVDERDAVAQARLELTGRESQAISLIRTIPLSKMHQMNRDGASS